MNFIFPSHTSVSRIVFLSILTSLCIFYFAGLNAASAQQPGSGKTVTVDGKKYILHSVKKGETWYGIAKNYGITYAELRMANKQSDDKLIIDKQILIPLGKLKANDPYYDKNYMDETSNISGEPQYHIVQKSQTLYSISKLHKVSVDDIKKWNGLKSNEISIGQKLIVSDSKNKNSVDQKDAPVNKPDVTIEKKEKAVIETLPPEPEKNVIKTDKVPKAPEEKTPVKKSDKVKRNEEVDYNPSIVSPENKGKVVFANSRRKVEEEGYATWAKEDENGDERYYALHKKAPIGTIIKVQNISNSKEIYVKVTGQLPDSFEDEDIVIKISKSSAEKLDAGERKFRVNLLYGLDKE